MARKPADGRFRVVIENVRPRVDCGEFPVKRISGDTVEVEADIFADGHDELATRLLYRAGDGRWQQRPMEAAGNDVWRGSFPVGEPGIYRFQLGGAIDHFASWVHAFRKRLAAGEQQLAVELEIGARMIDAAVGRARGPRAAALRGFAARLRAGESDAALEPRLFELMAAHPDLALETRSAEYSVIVDRERARFSAWYELFPRSVRGDGSHGTLRDVARVAPEIAALGFDVLYLPPVSPIGRAFRKGRNNSPSAAPGDVGSPWAVGAREGGHTAILPELGTLEDFRALVDTARREGMEIALDIAFQCSPDHPWVSEHPGWFKSRPDGSIQYAENPPKKYQDIYPLDFESRDWRALWDALRDVFLFWAAEGVRIFRVDNPHTKAFPFWQWAIAEIKAQYPEAIFLAEAFTRPRVMERLAKLGFSQSYTYFAWRNTGQELREYLEQLTRTPLREYFRPNFWPNTPDILPESLQSGGRPAFEARVMLAATLVSSYGIYGPAFELLESTPREPGAEEYLDSEKYEIRRWNLAEAAPMRRFLALLNKARRENRALQANDGLLFHSSENPMLLVYSKSAVDGTNTVLVAVNLDPFERQAGWAELDLAGLGLEPGAAFQLENQFSAERMQVEGSRIHFDFTPGHGPGCVYRLLRRRRTEKDFDYYW